MNELLDALGRFDTQLYLAITTSRNAVTAFLALLIVTANAYGLVWYVGGYVAFRGRLLGRRGLVAAATVLVGLALPWAAAELLKDVFRRPRPFDAIAGAPETLIAHPSSWSFPSGDAALAFGAAVALGAAYPRLRAPALLLAFAVALGRVAVGVHYPGDALAGALLGIAGGAVAPAIVARGLRRLRWRAFVVPHTHWDREWYERLSGYRLRLVPMVSKLLDLLERDPEFRSFTFDGQTIAIEDHLETRPEDRLRIEALVRAERLFVGPWYVLADLLLVSGESLVRNFQEGLRVSGELGRALRVAYVADPFGHPAQMPQLLRGFGYGAYVFARGVGDEGEELGSEFQWEAPSGDRVIASHQVAHYNNALALVGEGNETDVQLGRRVRRVLPRIFDRTAPYANGDALLLMVGDDHTEAYEHLADAVAISRTVLPRFEARITSLEEFASALPAPRGVLRGEMISGKYRPILRGVNSTRVWIKQENARCERLLLAECEPLDAIAAGTDRAELRSLWRTLLQNHPHDSICGCSIDAVHDLDMAPRFARVRSDGRALADRMLERLAGPPAVPMIFDPLPREREALVLVDGLPTRVRCAGLGVAPLERRPGRVAADGDAAIENEHLRVEAATDGSFVVIDRATGRRTGRLNEFVDDGDRGDEYTYSFAGPTVRAAGLDGIRNAGVSGDRAWITVKLSLPLPRGLRPDRLARDPDAVACPIRLAIALDAGARRVDVALTFDNQVRDHRLRALFDTGTRTLTHVAGAAFAWLERPNRIPAKPGWREPPTETHCAHDMVAVRGPSNGVAIGLDGLREYAVLGDGATIAVTLLRAVGWLSRRDLPERPGHAGPAIETPSAQCVGERTFHYCVVPLFGDRSTLEAADEIGAFLSPPRVVRGDGVERTWLRLEAAGAARLSALRSSVDGSLVLRLVNPSAEPSTFSLTFPGEIVGTRPADLREGEVGLGNTGLDVVRTAAPLVPDGRIATGALQPFEIGTWLVRLANG